MPLIRMIQKMFFSRRQIMHFDEILVVTSGLFLCFKVLKRIEITWWFIICCYAGILFCFRPAFLPFDTQESIIKQRSISKSLRNNIPVSILPTLLHLPSFKIAGFERICILVVIRIQCSDLKQVVLNSCLNLKWLLFKTRLNLLHWDLNEIEPMGGLIFVRTGDVPSLKTQDERDVQLSFYVLIADIHFILQEVKLLSTKIYI